MVMPKTIGRYEILEEVGRGSMGVVYRARDPRIGRTVALKTIAFSFPLGPGEEDEFLQRFYHEAQVAGRLNHPNIVTIYDVGEKGAGGDAYIAMEFVTGTNLHELLAGGGRLPLLQVADVMEKLFVGDSVTAISYQVVNVDPPPPSKLNPALRPPFDRIIRKTLAKNASDRYARCQDLTNDLKAAVTEWRDSSEQSTPPTLVSRDQARGDSAETAAAGVRGITFLAPRLSRLFGSGGTPLGLGWIAFLVCLVLLASAPFLLYRSPGGRATGSQPLGLLTAPAAAGPRGTAPGTGLAGLGAAAAPAVVDSEQAARLKLTLLHRFSSGRIEVRLDGTALLGERLKGGSGKTRFVRTLPVPPGSHRVEVRVVSGHNFDDVEGIQGDFRSKEQKGLQVTVSTIGKRLKLRFETPEGRTSHR